MRHLVLGGGGFIGYHLVERLIESEQVRVFDFNLEKYSNINSANLELMEGDFINCDYSVILQGVDIVWHLISTTVAVNGTSTLMEELNGNVLPTIRLLDAMVGMHIPKIIFLSSGGTVYGECYEPFEECDALNPICSYGVQKVTIEKCMALYRRYHGLQTIIARLSNPYGVKQGIKRRQGVIPIFMDQISENKTIEIWGDGEVIRDYIYIDDAIDALVSLVAYHGSETIFNIASGESISLNNLVSLIGEEMGKTPKVMYKPGRLCDVACNQLNTQKIYNECGWVAKTKLVDGIRLLISLKD